MGRTKKQVLTDPILSKGHSHPIKRVKPEVCPNCEGVGKVPGRIGNDKVQWECRVCKGIGEL